MQMRKSGQLKILILIRLFSKIKRLVLFFIISNFADGKKENDLKGEIKMELKNLKLSVSTLLTLSRIIDKMKIKDQLKGIDKQTNEEVAEEVLYVLIDNIYKCEDEIIQFIIDYKQLEEKVDIPNEEDLSEEEYEAIYKKKKFIAHQHAIEVAKQYNVVDLFKEILSVNGVTDFLS